MDPALTAVAPNPFKIAADLLDPPMTGALAYWDRPDLFAKECITWPAGEGPTGYQLAALHAVAEHHRVAERGPHGLGKTADAAFLILWFAITRDMAGVDWKIPTTASAWRQLTFYLWPEIHKWSKRIDWDKVGRRPFTRDELLTLSLKLGHCEAFAVACDDPATIEGAHATQILYVFDEAKTIPAGTWDAAEGAFSTAGEDTAGEAFAFAISTPGEPVGRFYDIQRRASGYDDWQVIHVTLDEAVDAGRIYREWADARAVQWGATSAVYLNRVEGEFASSDEDGVIPLAWVEAAIDRWESRSITADLGPLTAVGVDVARSGSDQTVLALRRGARICELRHETLQDTMATTGQVAGVLRGTPAVAIVDVIGIGAGVVDRLREQGLRVRAFNAAARSLMLDESGELGFVNSRAAAWWNLREMLDPASGCDLELPRDDGLVGDLTAPHWRVMSGGRIQIEAKDDLRKRLDRSTDAGDAVVQAFWMGDPEPETRTVVYHEPVLIGAQL